MHTIILDTSFLIDAARWKVDIFTELERICDFPHTLAILDKTMEELHGKKEEKLIKQIIAKKDVYIMQTGKGDVDDLLVGMHRVDKGNAGSPYVDDLLAAMQGKDLIIATQDKNLKKRLNVPIITIRQKKYLILTGA